MTDAVDDKEPIARERRSGKWLPGQSANPGGRSKVQRELQAILDEAGPHAIRRIVELCAHEDPKIALAASRDIADRVIGKARERDDDGQPVSAVAEAIMHLARGGKPDADP